ncbi:MAG: pentapeptide repeat-containing protein [candidate division Zixibacteria bacterium]|nr:pentapeptide repeat-containing protein [candidate division Zixibacteria bacterium]
MAKCKRNGCGGMALFKSDFCWEHIQDKEKYKKLILRRQANPERAYFGVAYLGGANRGGANLEGAYLGGANLDGANLKQTNLQRADLWRANLLSANLEDADLDAAILEKANLSRANLRRAFLFLSCLREANLSEAKLAGACLKDSNLIGADLSEADLSDADLRNANLNNADLSEAVLTGAKVWGMSHAGCKTEGIKADYLNFDKDGKISGIVRLNKEQAEEFFSSQPTIEILLQNKLPPYAIRTLLDLVDKINEQNPDWAVEFRKITSGSFLSELTVKASRDEILEEVANAILGAFKKGYQQKLLEYLPHKKAGEEHALILKKLETIENKIENPVEQVTIIHSTGKIPVNINFKESEVQVNVFGDVQKMINVEGNYYEISAPQGREDLIRNIIDQLDSPEIKKRIGEAEAQLKGFSTEQVKFLEEQFKESVEKIFKEKQKEVEFFDKIKAFSRRFSESSFAGVIGNAIWFFIKKFALPNM